VSRRLPNRPQDALGRPRDHFFKRPFRRAFRRRLPQRFPIDFRSISGRSEARLTAQAQCFVRVGRFSSQRPVNRQIERKSTTECPQYGTRSRQNARPVHSQRVAGRRGRREARIRENTRPQSPGGQEPRNPGSHGGPHGEFGAGSKVLNIYESLGTLPGPGIRIKP
jgi:hypothetical protein